MRVLVIDLDRIYAATLGQVLNSLGCTTCVASTTSEAVSSLRGKRFDVILMDVRWLASCDLVVLQELYVDVSRRLDSPRICLMSNSPASSLLSQVQSSGALESVPATAKSILSIVRSTECNDGILVVGTAATAELIQTLFQEGFPAVVVHSLDSAIRHHFHDEYLVVFLETGETALVGPDNFRVLQRITAEPLACLASMQKDSYLRHVVKPQTIWETTQLRKDFQNELGDAEVRLSVGRA